MIYEEEEVLPFRQWTIGDLDDCIIATLVWENGEYIQLAREMGIMPEMFSSLAHREVAKTIFKMSKDGEPIDELTIAHRLCEGMDVADPDNFNPYYFLIRSIQRMEVVVNAKWYLTEFVERWKRRAGRDHTAKMSSHLIDGKKFSVVKEKTITGLNEIDLKGNFQQKEKLDVGVVEKYIESVSSGHSAPDSVSWTLIDMDKAYQPIGQDEICVVAARPSKGKTSLAVQISRNIIDNAGTVIFHFLESSKLRLILRMACQSTRLSFDRIKGHRDGKEMTEKLKQAAAYYTSLTDERFFLFNNPRLSGIMANTEAAAQKAGKVNLVVVDYIQKIDAQMPAKESRNNQLGEVMRILSEIPNKYGCPILILSQLNRDCEKQNRPPRLSDLRESGAIEQDADRVVFPYFPEGENGEERSHYSGKLCHLAQAKMRDGAIGFIKTVFLPEFTLFENYCRGVQ